MSDSDATTVYDAFLASAARWPDNGCVAAPPAAGRDYHPDGIEYTFAQLAGQVSAAKDAYADAGYGHGHRVALLLENRPEFFVHYLALNGLGVSIVPVNPDYRHDEMLFQIEHSQSCAIVTLGKRLADLTKVADQAPRRPGVVAFEDFPAGLAAPAAPAPRPGTPGLQSECSLLYTSGTTGRPKGCILTNDYYLTAGQWYLNLGGLADFRAGRERVYNPLPLFHMNAQAVTATGTILSGSCLIAPDRFHPTDWWDDLIATKATVIHYLGVVAPMLLNQPKRPEERAHSVRFGLGAGIEPNLHQVFEDRFGFPLVEVWGMTETGRITAMTAEPRRIHTRAFGRAMPGLDARVVDETDADVPDGTEGELLVRHSAADPRKGFFAGYLKNDVATAEAWKGGWFHTGDTVTRGADGTLYFVDRKKNIIRRSGENIAAAEVEACIQAMDEVQQIAVIAVADDVREEEVMACVVPMPGVVPSAELAEKIFAHADERLAYFKPPGWIVFLSSIPTTGTQKIQKQNIFADGEDPTKRPDALDFRARKKRRKT